MTPKQKTYGLIFIIALLFSVVAYNLIYTNHVHQIAIKDIISDNKTNKVSSTVFYDIDNDGIKEELTFGKDRGNKSISYLVVRREDRSYIGQFNFKHANMGLEWIAYSDLNNDSSKEIIAFYEKRDTIFATIIDWKNDTYLAEEVFVLAKPDTIYDDVWAPYLRVIGDVSNSRNETEIILSITTGFAQVPRGVFAFNTTSKKITKDFVIGASIGKVKLFDLDKDGIEEIIINTNSPANNGALPKLPYFNDFKTWLIVLDTSFDTLFTVCVDSIFGTLQSSYLKTEKENFLISAFTTGMKHQIMKINKKGKIVKEILFKDGSGFLYGFEYNENDKILIPIKKTLNVLDSDLNLIEKHKFNDIIGIVSPYNLDSDNETEYILWKQYGGINILDDDFSIITSIDNKIKFHSFYSSITHNKTKDGMKFIFNSLGENLRFNVIENPYYTYRFILFLEILLVVYFIGILLHVLLKRFLVFITLLELSTQKSDLGIIILTSTKKFNFVNNSAKRVLSSTHSTIKNKDDLSVAIKGNKQLDNFIRNISSGTTEARKEIHLTNGKIVDVYILPISTPLGLPLVSYIQINDLTESLLSDRAKTLAHSIQKVAHEIKTPLSSVLLRLDSLEQNLIEENKNELVKDDFNIAREEIDRIKKFINSFLKFANMAGTQLNSYNLKELIENSLIRFSTYLSNGINIKIDVCENINVLVDSYQMEEVFQVFIENSIDAMHGKGNITISATEGKSSKVAISIIDNGKGINKEQLPSIFQPYMTTKEDGTGMGLAIAKKILEDHGSEIQVNSILGKGTEFRFRLKIVIE